MRLGETTRDLPVSPPPQCVSNSTAVIPDRWFPNLCLEAFNNRDSKSLCSICVRALLSFLAGRVSRHLIVILPAACAFYFLPYALGLGKGLFLASLKKPSEHLAISISPCFVLFSLDGIRAPHFNFLSLSSLDTPPDSSLGSATCELGQLSWGPSQHRRRLKQ